MKVFIIQKSHLNPLRANTPHPEVLSRSLLSCLRTTSVISRCAMDCDTTPKGTPSQPALNAVLRSVVRRNEQVSRQSLNQVLPKRGSHHTPHRLPPCRVFRVLRSSSVVTTHLPPQISLRSPLHTLPSSSHPHSSAPHAPPPQLHREPPYGSPHCSAPPHGVATPNPPKLS